MNWLTDAPLYRAVVLDIDGVLTDGRLGYGVTETIKFFHARDGHAIKMAMRAHLKIGIISGRDDGANRRRIKELGLSFAYLGEKNKAEAFQRMLAEQELKAGECVYMGDDVVDIPLFRLAGAGVCVADAPEEVRAVADWQTSLAGGHGAVRELLVLLLKARGDWDRLMQRYLNA